MPVGFNSPARNLFLLGSSGAQVVTNFFKTIDQSAGTDGVYLPDEIKYNSVDQKFVLAGSASDSNSKGFGWFEKRDQAGTADFENRIESTQSGVNTKLRALHLDSNDNLIVVGGVGDIPWIAKYSNGGVIDWQSTTNSANVEYTGVTSDSNGNYYACGLTPSSGDAQAFVEKFDANGNPGWGKSAFMLGRDVVLEKIAANDRGEVVAVGLLQDDEAYKGYIVKIDTNTGEVLWDRTLRSYEDNVSFGYTPVFCEDVFIDSKDQIYIVGRYFDTSESRGFIVKYTAEGNMIWQKETPVGENIEYYEVKSDGETEQTIVFGRYIDSNNNIGGVLSKYSKNGNLVWRRTLFSSYNNSDTFGQAGGKGICLDADPSFYYLLYFDDAVDGFSGTPEAYTFGKVSSSGNGLGVFQYDDGTGETIDYEILSIGDKIGRLSDGSVRQDTSDLITYPFNANKLLFDDLATQVSNKKRQMDGPDSFEYSGSPAIRPADFQELNLLGDVYSGSGDWLDQSGKGNDGAISGATHNAAGYWEFDGVDDYITMPAVLPAGADTFTIEAWVRRTGNNSINTAQVIWEQNTIGQTNSTRASLLTNASGPVSFSGQSCDRDMGYTLVNNEWTYLVCTVDTSDGTNPIKFYLNGDFYSQGQTSPSAAASLNIGTYHCGIGRKFPSNAGNPEWWNGDIGEVRIYPRALTAAQVFQNYNATKTKYIEEAPDTAPKIGSGIVYDSNLLLNYDFGNRATYDRAENLLPWSEDFTKWTQAVHFWENNYAIAPDGTKTAALLKESIPPQQQLSYFNIATMPNVTVASGDTFTFTVFAKANTHNVLEMHMYGDAQANFNLATGVTTNNGASMSAVGDGWYFCKWTRTKSNTNGAMYLGISANTYAGVGVDKSVFIWHPQVERGYEYGRYIKTSGISINAPTTVKNLSSSSYTGTINGATFNPAGYFETTSNAWVSAGYGATGTSDMTIEQWVRANSFPNTFNALFYSQSSNVSGYYGAGYSTTIGWNFSDYNGSVRNIASSGTTASVNTWYHFVARRSGGNLTVHINGVDITSTSASTSISFTAADPRIGSNPGAPAGEYWDGDIAETRIYNRALSSTEISQNFNATRAKYGV